MVAFDGAVEGPELVSTQNAVPPREGKSGAEEVRRHVRQRTVLAGRCRSFRCAMLPCGETVVGVRLPRCQSR